MSEYVDFGIQSHDCELLNLPQELLVQIASGVGYSQRELQGHLEYFKHFNGLQEQIAFNIQNIKDKYQGYGKEAEAAESAFISGALMTFELVRRATAQNKLTIPDPPYYAELPIDGDPQAQMPDEIWVIDLCDREEFLPKQFPNFFEACLIMAGNITQEDPQEIRKMLYSSAIPSAVTRKPFYILSFFSGAAEIINHLERHAWVEKMRASFTPDELKLFNGTSQLMQLREKQPPPTNHG